MRKIFSSIIGIMLLIQGGFMVSAQSPDVIDRLKVRVDAITEETVERLAGTDSEVLVQTIQATIISGDRKGEIVSF